MPAYDARCPNCEQQQEIEKPMSAPMPPCPDCGAPLMRIYTPVTVQYNAPGFHTTDFTRFEKQIGPERAAQFRAQRKSAEARARAGRLTPYEKALESMA